MIMTTASVAALRIEASPIGVPAWTAFTPTTRAAVESADPKDLGGMLAAFPWCA